VPVALGHGDQDAVVEDRAEDADVVEMGATGVGVVEDEDVALADVAGERVEHGLRGEVQRPDLDGHVLAALCDGVAVGVAEGAGEVPRVDDEREIGRAHV